MPPNYSGGRIEIMPARRATAVFICEPMMT
jgi:hypothetical protein